MDELFRKVVIELGTPFQFIGYCSRVSLHTDSKTKIYKPSLSSIRKYIELDDLDWILENGYEQLALYRIKRGDRLVVKPNSTISLLCRVKDQTLFKYFYNQYQDLFYKNKYLDKVAANRSPQSLESLKILEKQTYPIDLPFTYRVYDSAAGISCNKDVIEYIANNRPDVSYGHTFLTCNTVYKLKLDEIAYLVNHYIDNIDQWKDQDIIFKNIVQYLIYMKPAKVKDLVTKLFNGKRHRNSSIVVNVLGSIHTSIVNNYKEYTVEWENDQFEILEWLVGKLVGTIGSQPFTDQWRENITKSSKEIFNNNNCKETTQYQLLHKWLEYFCIINLIDTPRPIIRESIKVLVKSQSLPIVKYLIDYEQREYIPDHVFDLICKYGTLDQIKYGHSIILNQIKENNNNNNQNNNNSIFILNDPSRYQYKYHTIMIERGDVEIVKFLLNNPIGLTPQHISIIDFSPKLASVSKYLLECKNIDRVYKLHINSVSVLLMGDLELIKMVLSGVDPSKITITQHMLDIIIGSSQCLEIIEYIHRLPMFPVNRAFISACSIGNLKVVKFLNETFRSTIVVPLDLNSFLDLALHHYHLDIVDYLITNRNLHQGELFNLQSLKRVIIKNDNNLFDLVFKNLDQIYKKDSPKFVMEMVFKNGRLELLHYILTQYKDIDWFCNIELIKLSIGKHHKSIILYWFDKKQKQISETNTSTSILEQLFRESLKLQSRPIAQFFYQELTKRNQSVGVLSRKDLQHILWNKNISIVDYIYNLGLLPKEELLDPSFYLFKISNNLERYLIKKGYTKVWMDHKEYLEHIEIFVSKDKILQGNKSNKQLLLGQQSKYTKEKREEIFGMVFGNHYLLSKILQHTQSFFSTEIKLGKMLSRFEAMQTDRYHYYGMIKQNVPFVISHELVATMFDIDLLENTKRQYPEVFRDETLFTLAIQRSNYVLVEFMLKGDSPFSVDSDLLYSIRSTSRVVYKMVMNHNQCRVIPTLKSLSLLFTVISPNYKYYKKYYQWYYRYETVMKMINNTPGGYPSLENYSTRESIILNQLFNSKNNKRSLNAKHLGLEMLKLINDTNFFPSTFSVGDLMDDAIQRTKKSIVTFLYYNTPHNYTNPLGFYVYPSKNLMEVLRFSNNFLLPKDPVVSVALFENVNNPVVLSYLYQNQFDRNRTQNLISFKGIAKNSNKSIQKFVYENCPQTHLETMHTTALYSIVESNFGYSYSFKYLMERYKNVVYGQSLLTLSTRITQEFYFNYYHRLEQDRDMDMDMETISPIHLDIYGVKILIQNFNMYPIQFESPSDQYILDYYLQVSKNPSSVYELCNYSPLFNLETNFQILKHIPEIIPDFVNQVLHDGDIITYKQLLHYNHNEFGGAVDYGILLSSTSPSHMELFRVVLETDPRLLIFERYFGVCISKDINKYNLLKKMVSSTNRDDINVVNIKVEIIVGALKSKYFEFAMFVILDREFMTNNYINHSKEINDKEWVKLFVDEITLNDKAKIVKEVLSNIYIIPSPVLEFYFDSFRINNSEHDLPAIKATKSKQF